VREAIPGVQVVGTHGPAEAAHATAFTAPRETDATCVRRPLGSPLGGVRVRVLDSALRPVPTGVTGELYIAGEVARGYHGRAGLTAERFVADPCGPFGGRLYRTGDLVRRCADGTLEYVDPESRLPRVRGRRMAPGEVAAVLAAHPDVSRATALVREVDGEASLAAYVVPVRGGDVRPAELGEFLARHLPDHLAPAVFGTLDELPLAADGTIDRDALPEPGADPSHEGRRGARTEQERAICDVIAEVLGVAEVGIDDNLFALGCNSLKATRILGRMRRTLGLETTIRRLFQYPTVATLSEHLTPAAAGKRPALGRQIRTELKEQVPLMRKQAKEQAKDIKAQLKEELTTAALEQWTGEGLEAAVQADIDERIRTSVRRSTGYLGGGSKGKDAKETARLLKRMLERFTEQVQDSARNRSLSGEQLDQVQEILAATADSLRPLLREVSEKAG
jgi:aryl carrier-like protein